MNTQCEINLGGGVMGNKFAGKVLQRKPRARRGIVRSYIWAVGEGEVKLPLWMTTSYKGPLPDSPSGCMAE